MFSRHIIVSAILGLFAGSVVGVRSRRSVYYHGPPAPLNHDGTVANTPEVQNAAAAQKAAFAAEFNRLHETERLAAAHPDFTSPSYSKGDQNIQNVHQGKSYSDPQFYNTAPLNKDGTVALTPEVQQARAAHQAAFAAEYQRYQEAARLAAAHPDLTSPQKGYGAPSSQYKFNQQPQYNQQQSYAYNAQAWIPAPLNQDGTVAHTAEYKAVAAAHQAEYAKVLQNVKYQNSLAQFKQEPGYSNNYW